MKCPECGLPRARLYGMKRLGKPHCHLLYYRCREPACAVQWRARLIFERRVKEYRGQTSRQA